MNTSTLAPRLDYRVIDADNHYYEPADCFLRHMESNRRQLAITVERGEDGLGRMWWKGDRLRWVSVLQADYIGAPGALREFFEGGADRGFVQVQTINAHEHPPFMDRRQRLSLMDEQGIEAILMLPTTGLVVEYELRSDVEAVDSNVRAFNRWLEEDWGFGADGRIVSAPMISLIDVERAVRELERVLALGARAIVMKPGPAYGRSPADPLFDPFWARVQEAGVLATYHAAPSGYLDFFSREWGERPMPRLQEATAFQWLTCTVDRSISDTLASLVLNNLFGRFPTLRVASIENGAAWVGPLLHDMDKAAQMAHDALWPGGRLDSRPSEIFKRHIWVTPFFEEDPSSVVDLMGADRVLFGSDFPHPEGLADPVEYADKLTGLSPVASRQIMRDNAAGLLGLN